MAYLAFDFGVCMRNCGLWPNNNEKTRKPNPEATRFSTHSSAFSTLLQKRGVEFGASKELFRNFTSLGLRIPKYNELNEKQKRNEMVLVGKLQLKKLAKILITVSESL